MEMVQYHPTTLKSNGVLITEAARGEGAYLLNKDGDRFMERYAPNMMELASRDVVSRAEQTEINEGRGIDGCVLLDLRHLGRNFIEERLRYINEVTMDFLGMDLADQPIPIRPGMHYQMGGVKTNVDGATQIPGLYAAGECACVSVHGGNRLGANSLLDTVIFGRRSGVAATEFALGKTVPAVSETVIDTEQRRLRSIIEREIGEDNVASIRLEMGQVMNENLAVFREKNGMEAAKRKIVELKERSRIVGVRDKGRVYNTALLFSLELEFMLDCAEVIAVSGLSREESRGAHFRVDMRERDDKNFLKHTVATKTEKGPDISFSPVTITRWQPEERKY